MIKEASSGREIKRGGRTVSIPGKDVVTSNEAEYLGLIDSLRQCIELHAERVSVKGDSDLVIQQMRGTNRVRHENLIPLHQQAQAFASQFPHIDFEAIPRARNTVADSIANFYASQRNLPVPPDGQPAPRPDFTQAWMQALELAVGSISHHRALEDALQRVPESEKAFPPSFLPPAAPLAGSSVHSTQQTYSAPGSIRTPSIQTQQDRNTSQATSQGTSRVSTPFSALFDDNDNDDNDNDTVDENQVRAALENQTPELAARRLAVHRDGLASLQVRYLLGHVRCGLTEAYRLTAHYFATQKQWRPCAQQWSFAYDIVNSTIIDLDSLVAQRMAGILEHSHNLVQLDHVLFVLNLVKDDTKRERDIALERMHHRLTFLDRKLNPLREERDQVKQRWGIQRWTNNPQPKMDYATRIIMYQKEKNELERAIGVLQLLHLQDEGVVLERDI